jgi:hypothetical protein
MKMSRGERALTAIVVAATAILIAAFIWAVLESHSGRMPYEFFVIACSALSGALTVIVLVYAAIIMRSSESNKKRYEEYAEERRRKRERSGICHLLYHAIHYSHEASTGRDGGTTWMLTRQRSAMRISGAAVRTASSRL